MTKLFGIVAHPVEHSLSPAMHNAAFKALGTDATFERFDVLPEGLGEFMRTRTDIEGLSVSHPHKESVIPYLDAIEGPAQQIGAVNTVYKKDGKRIGANTDGAGFIQALQEVMPDLRDKRVVVLGAGGAAHAIVATLVPFTRYVTIINRTVPKGVALGKKFGCRYGGKMEDLVTETPALIVNATSVGLEKNEEPELVPQDFLKKEMVVFDINYRKDRDTRLIQEAKNVGATTLTGKRMLLCQSFRQFELWTGKDAPEDVMREAIGL